MQGLLKAMGALIWASVALLLAAGIAVLGYRSSIILHQARLLDLHPLTLQHQDAGRAARSEVSPIDHDQLADLLDITTARQLFDNALKFNRADEIVHFGSSLVAQHLAHPRDLVDMADAYVNLGDCPAAITRADEALLAVRNARGKIDESFYLAPLECAARAHDGAKERELLLSLIGLSDRPEYWRRLLYSWRADEPDERALLKMYEILYRTSWMTRDLDYLEMAYVLSDLKREQEALSVLERAERQNLVQEVHEQRVQRVMKTLSSRLRGEAQIHVEKDLSPHSFNIEVTLGELYFGRGDYEIAVEHLGKAVRQGHIDNPEDVYMYLALAQASLRHFTEARAAIADMLEYETSPMVRETFKLYANSQFLGN